MSLAEKSAGMSGYSETKGNVIELSYNNKQDNKQDAEKFGDNSKAFSLSLIDSLGVDNKGFDCYAMPTCSPDQMTVANVDEVKKSDAFSKSSEQNNDHAASETLTIKKPSIVSCDLESALPAAQRIKTVRAWLNDPHLYKVIPLSSLNYIR